MYPSPARGSPAAAARASQAQAHHPPGKRQDPPAVDVGGLARVLVRLAVMGAFIVTYPRDQIRTLLFIFVFARIRFIPAALLIGLWFISQLFHAGAVAHVQSGGVAYLAHIGGFIFGAATARLFEGQRRIA